jgi:hypothetical protein
MVSVSAQDKGWLQVRVHDAWTGLPLGEATIQYAKSRPAVSVMSNGIANFSLIDGTYTLFVQCAGYRSMRVGPLEILPGRYAIKDVFLQPVAAPDSSRADTVRPDAVMAIKPTSLLREPYRLRLEPSSRQRHTLQQADISESTDRDLSWLLRRQGGGFVSAGSMSSQGEGLVQSGMGERYSPVLLNGMPAAPAGPAGRNFMFSVYPTDAVAGLQQFDRGSLALPADYAGSVLDIRMKDIPNRDFVVVQGGLSITSQASTMLRSPWKTADWIGVSSAFRQLPGWFPQTRSKSPLADLNVQEKSDVLDALPNAMEATSYDPVLAGTRFMAGVGKRYDRPGKATWGFSAHMLHQTRTEQVRASTAVGPDIGKNRFPFSTAVPLVSAYADDQQSLTTRSLSLTAGAGVSFRKNLITLHLQTWQVLDETVTDRLRIYKPDEDSLASFARMYQAKVLGNISLQLSGVHALGKTSSLLVDWQVAYTYMRPQKPDERHLLFRPESGGEEFSLSTPQVLPFPDRNNVGNAPLAANLNAIYPNSYRSWERANDHHFSARAGIRFPFLLAGRTHLLSAGMLMQTHFRESYTDRFMYWGGEAGQTDDVLGSGSFYPGGVQVEEYYTKAISSSGFFQFTDLQEDNLGNYTGSLNNGATYLQYSGYLLPQLVLSLGLRAESSSQLVSSTEYNFFEEFRNYRLTTLNENATVSRFDLLPLVGLRYAPLQGLILHASYYQTLNRPQMQELSAFRYYDPAMFLVNKGNPFLESTRIQNFVAGIDWRHAGGFGISAEMFYRDIDQPIEQVVSRFAGMRGVYQLTPNNMPRARVKGLKADIDLPFTHRNRSLLSFLSLRAGGVLSSSEVEAGPLRSGLVPNVAAHQLSGTPDYTGYAGLVINHPGGFGFSAIYQVIGDRVFAVGSGAVLIEDGSDAVLAIPHYQEKGRSEINIQASYAFFQRRLQVILGAENLFRTPYVIYQDLDGNGSMGEPIRFDPMPGGGRYVSGQDLVVRRIDQVPRYYFRLMFTW